MTEEFNNGVAATENVAEEMTTENTNEVEVDEQQAYVPAEQLEAYNAEAPEAPAYTEIAEPAAEPENGGVDPKVIAAGVAGTIVVLGATAAVVKKTMPAIKEKTAQMKAKITEKWEAHKEKKAKKLDERANKLRGITKEDPAKNDNNSKK